MRRHHGAAAIPVDLGGMPWRTLRDGRGSCIAKTSSSGRRPATISGNVMRVVMIGTGYVGLVSGACFADFGHEVTCIDKDEGKIAALEKGVMPIFEPGLDVLVESNVKAGRLSFATDPDAVKAADVVFLAVGTPTRRGDGHADLTYVYAAAEEIGRLIDRLHGDRHQIDGAGGDRRRGGGDHPPRRAGGRIRRRLQPGVPARGRGDRGLQAAGPGGGRGGDGARARGAARALPPALPQRDAGGGDEPAHGRAHQVRRQRVPRDQDRLHQRDRRPVRRGRRQRAAGRQAASASTSGSAASSSTPAPATAARASPRTRSPCRARPTRWPRR